MKFLSSALILFIAFSFSNRALAQSSVGIHDFQEVVKMEMSIMKGFTSYQKAIFETDSQNDIIIDFQEIPVNLKTIKVLDNEANIVYTEDVQNLAVNALYELDMSAYPKGHYTLQLDAYTSSFFIDLPTIK
ncbi:MAG TPA: hypothetical protein ENK85_08355 [Saprospiraceae bacterium]|nr:hypothetical protein [Saprospiraceae bacterium]